MMENDPFKGQNKANASDGDALPVGLHVAGPKASVINQVDYSTV